MSEPTVFDHMKLDEALWTGAAIPFDGMYAEMRKMLREFYGHFEQELRGMGYTEENPPPPELTLVTWHEVRDGKPSLCGKLEWQHKKEHPDEV